MIAQPHNISEKKGDAMTSLLWGCAFAAALGALFSCVLICAAHFIRNSLDDARRIERRLAYQPRTAARAN